MDALKFNLDLKFSIPSEWLLDRARRLVKSEDADIRVVAKAVIDATAVAVETQNMVQNAGEDTEVSLDAYLDHWFGDSIEAAGRLLASKDEDWRLLAETLISQEKAVVASKESVLKEHKRISQLFPNG